MSGGESGGMINNGEDQNMFPDMLVANFKYAQGLTPLKHRHIASIVSLTRIRVLNFSLVDKNIRLTALSSEAGDFLLAHLRHSTL